MDIDDFIRAVPKVELHRHLSGSGRSEAMFAIARRQGLTVEGGDLETFRNLTSMYRTPPGFHAFLAKFKPRARFFTKPGLIAEVITSVIQDALADNLMYLEARFSASHFSRHMGFDLDMVAERIITTARTAAAAGGMDIGFVMVLTRDLGVEENRRMLDVVLSSRLGAHFAGIDIAGDEAGIPLAPYLPLIRAAREGGKRVTIHAGEAGPASNVAEAIAAGAERIGHGINAFRDPGVLALARDRGIAFEVCPTSNLDTGVIADLGVLDLKRLLDGGVRITLNTDDPGISATTLTEEYRKVQAAFGLDAVDIRQLIHNGIDAAFISAEHKTRLRDRLQAFEGTDAADGRVRKETEP